MNFEFATAPRIIFGPGTFSQIGTIAKSDGQRALVVTGRNPLRAEPLLARLRGNSIDAVVFSVVGEPEIETVRLGVARAKREQCDQVIGFGGGSALDAGKAIAALLANDGDVLDYLEIIGRGKGLAKPPVHYIAIPTTAGTGAEVTRNAVLYSPEHRLKVSLRSPFMLPRVALVDPELTHDLPSALTATTGLDALTQLIEPYVCLRANPMTDGLCVKGICLAARSLHRAVEHGGDAAAREDMALASLFSGIALANAGLGAVHGFAGPIGGRFTAPHGAVCAALLPHVMAANLRALRKRDPNNFAVTRYREIARLLTADGEATEDQAVEWVGKLVADLQIPNLRAYGIFASHTDELVANAANASSMKANPVALTPAELAQILEAAR